MTEIIPAIIPKDIGDLEDHLSHVVGLVKSVQIDVLDGKFLQAKSWPYIPEGNTDFSRIIREEEGLPFWEDVEFEVDLMIADPAPVLSQWVAAGASRLVIHAEAVSSPQVLEEIIVDFKKQFSLIGSSLSVQIGIALGLDTDISLYESAIGKADFFQCMGIAQIGVQGNPFDERAIARIQDIKTRFPNLTISVDGGVTLESAPRLIDAGATRLVVGSAIFRSEDIPATIKEFKNL